MGHMLVPADEGAHEIGEESNWNESRYNDFYDPQQRVGGWLRIGNRPNEGHGEMSACLNLPDGDTAFMFGRIPIESNELSVGPQSWEIGEPFVRNRLRYSGEIMRLQDAWLLTEPKTAFTTAPREQCELDFEIESQGLRAVMGFDQDHIDQIFLPGQAAFHYQHLSHTTGTLQIGNERYEIDGRGGKDHSWGPRNWHAKIYMRWLIANVDDDLGFMLTRGVGPTKRTRGGFVWEAGNFYLVDDFEMQNVYADAPHYELTGVEVAIRSGDRSWSAQGRPVAWVPLRHRQPDEHGNPATVRIVKSPVEWTFEGRQGVGMAEYHDLMVDGKPVGLED